MSVTVKVPDRPRGKKRHMRHSNRHSSSYVWGWGRPWCTAWLAPCSQHQERFQRVHWQQRRSRWESARREWGGSGESSTSVSEGKPHHVCCGSQLIHDGLSCQLHLTDDTGQESCNLIQPPLQTVHQHAGHGQLEERTPLLQALSGPAFRKRQNAFTAAEAAASMKTFHFMANVRPNLIEFTIFFLENIKSNSINDTQALILPFQVALCSPLKWMYPNKNMAKEYWEMALAHAEPLQWKQERSVKKKKKKYPASF